ncbi:hypothetical protein [Amycolatopsis sp. WQ 127309]|uniref:hypothetical protein n=1 Tax=Amycolatopsis sp. WQ 127309 TaxID=2932773 RepID=UPI001FF6C4EA|nr:hypothetical protein [Amycolatopsis sp. WQ 127309]UOZ07564.1 hypothetical protein MUY22_04520 [Amycolatopsis sp. WQ 127309]
MEPISTGSKVRDCAEVAGQVAVGAAMAALFAVWCSGTADARPIPVGPIDGSPATTAPKPAAKAPVKAETPNEAADRETRKFQNDIKRDEKQQEKSKDADRETRKFENDVKRGAKQEKSKADERKSDDDRETRKFENDVKRDVKQEKSKADERKSDDDRETRKFENDVKRDAKQEKSKADERKSDDDRETRKFENDVKRGAKQQEKDKADERKSDDDRETRKFENDVKRDAKQEKDKADERKSDDDRETRKFENQIVRDAKQQAENKDADRENDRFAAQIERDRPKDTAPDGTTRSVKAWETAQQVAKDAGRARDGAYDLAATRDKGATGSVRAWETTARLADEAEVAAQQLEYVRDVGRPETALPSSTFEYNKNVVSPNYAGDAAETLEGVEWQRFPGAPGGIPVGLTPDGSKVVVVKDPITPEAPLSPEMMKYLGAGNFVDRGQTADGRTVLVLHPRTHIDDNADALAAQWDNVVNGRIEGLDDVGKALGGTVALTLDRTIGLGQGDLYGAGEKCQDTGDCGDSLKEGVTTALSVAPVGRLAGLVGKGAAATGRAAERILPPALTAVPGRIVPPAITAIPGRAVDGASAAFAAAKASPIATYVPEVARAAATKAKGAAARVPGVQAGAALVRPVAASVLPKAQRAFDAVNKVPPARYALYQHNVGNAFDEAGHVEDCVRGDGCAPAATGAGLLAFDLAKGRGLTDAYRDAPGCADGHADACVLTGLDALAVPPVNRLAKTPASTPPESWYRAPELSKPRLEADEPAQFLARPDVQRSLANSTEKVEVELPGGTRTEVPVGQYIQENLPGNPELAAVLHDPANEHLAAPLIENPERLASVLAARDSIAVLRSAVEDAAAPLRTPVRAAATPRLPHRAVSRAVGRRVAGLPPGAARQQEFRGTPGDDAAVQRYLDDRYEEAERAMVTLGTVGNRVAGRVGGTYKPRPALKERKRVMEKIDEKYDGNPAPLVDIAAGTIVVKSVDDAYAALARVARDKDLDIVSFDDRFAKPQSSGYRDLQMNVRMPDGHVAEMRIQVDALQRVSDDVDHALYEIHRTFTEPKDGGITPAHRKQQELKAALQGRARDLFAYALPRDTTGLAGLPSGVTGLVADREGDG